MAWPWSREKRGRRFWRMNCLHERLIHVCCYVCICDGITPYWICWASSWSMQHMWATAATSFCLENPLHCCRMKLLMAFKYDKAGSSTSILSDWLGTCGYIGTFAICLIVLEINTQKTVKNRSKHEKWMDSTLKCLHAGWKYIYDMICSIWVIYTRNIYIILYIIHTYITYDVKDPYFELQVAPVPGA